MAIATVSLVTRVMNRTIIRNRPFQTKMALVATDVISLILAVCGGIAVERFFTGHANLSACLSMWPFLMVFLAGYQVIGLYDIVSLSPPEELQRATLSSSVLFLLLAAMTISGRGAEVGLRWVVFTAMLLSVVFLPLLRACTRQAFAGRTWWGYPAVIFGARAEGERVLKAMTADIGLGLKPIAFVDETYPWQHLKGVPVFGEYEGVERMVKGREVFAILTDRTQVDRYRGLFRHVIVIPELGGISSLWVSSKNIGGMLGLEINQSAVEHRLKLALDLAIACLFGVVAGPICVLIALAIKLDSRGPVLYSQKRIGRDGKLFQAWKFRSMVLNSAEMLKEHLAANPEARAEWEASQKLRNDPRVTRVGRFLRKSSLDELPQIWNVLRGDMSFVGPRPIVENEVRHYGDHFDLYKEVKGGITGLWQVSGRSDTTYAERVELDSFYARNWSVWMDLCILFRTFSVVLFGKGAC